MRPTRAGFTVAIATASVRLTPATRITFEMAASIRKADPASRVPPRRTTRWSSLQFHFDLAQTIGTRRAQRRHHGVRDQYAPLDALGPQGDAQERIRQMVPVDNEARRQLVLGQLLPEVVGMAGKHRVGAIAQMGGERRSGANRVLDLLARRPRVADAGDHAFPRELFDVVSRLGPFRG